MFVFGQLESNKWSVNGKCLNSRAEIYVLNEIIST